MKSFLNYQSDLLFIRPKYFNGTESWWLKCLPLCFRVENAKRWCRAISSKVLQCRLIIMRLQSLLRFRFRLLCVVFCISVHSIKRNNTRQFKTTLNIEKSRFKMSFCNSVCLYTIVKSDMVYAFILRFGINSTWLYAWKYVFRPCLWNIYLSYRKII